MTISKPAKILFVDDNPNILQAMQRQLKRKFDVLTAGSGKQALETVKVSNAIAVVVADMRMPEMDGVEFLSQLKVVAPNTVRIMLTGNVDQTTAIQAINQGSVFRFLSKPVDVLQLEQSLDAALEIYRLRESEAELLNNTLKGTAELLAQLVEMIDPELFGQLSAMRVSIKEVSKQLNITDSWELEIAALLSQIGKLAIPPEIKLKIKNKEKLSFAESDLVDDHAETAYEFLKNIPRLENVAEMVRYQNKNNDGSGRPRNTISKEDIPIGSKVIKVLQAFGNYDSPEADFAQFFVSLIKQPLIYDPEAVQAVQAALLPKSKPVTTDTQSIQTEHATTRTKADSPFTKPEITQIHELAVDDIPLDDIRSKSGVLILQATNPITAVTLVRIQNYHRFSGVNEPIRVVRRTS